MTRRVRRLTAVLTMVLLLLAISVGGTLATPHALPKGPKKGKTVHIVGTVSAYTAGSSLTIVPKSSRGGKKSADPVVFTITADTRVVGPRADAGAPPTPRINDRVNVVGRVAADGQTIEARLIVVQAPGRVDDDAGNKKGEGRDKGKGKT